MKAPLLLSLLISGIIAGFFGGCYAACFGVLPVATSLLFENHILKFFPSLSHKSLLRSSLLASLFFIIGASASGIAGSHIPHIKDLDDYKIVAEVVDSRLSTEGERYSLSIITIDGRHYDGDIFLLASPSLVFQPGDVISFKSNLKSASSIPFARQRFYASLTTSDSIVTLFHQKNEFKSFFYRLKENIDFLISSSSLDSDGKALLKALIIADRSDIDPSILSLFRNHGVMHVLAVSGMHIGIIYIILLLLTRPLVLLNRNLRYYLIVAAIWGFVFLTVCNLSTVRAAIMLSIANIGLLYKRRCDPFETTCFALMFILFISPSALFDVGLQLSFASVAAITFFSPRLNPIDRIRSKTSYNIFSAVVSTIIATSTTWIITGFYFNNISLRFLPANLLIIPILPFYMSAGMLYLLLLSFGFDCHPLAYLLNSSLSAIYNLLDVISAPSTPISVSGVSLSLWIIGIIFLAFSLRKIPGLHFNAPADAPTITIVRPWMIAAIALFSLSLIAIYLQF